jgi:hypothetical protein
MHLQRMSVEVEACLQEEVDKRKKNCCVCLKFFFFNQADL